MFNSCKSQDQKNEKFGIYALSIKYRFGYDLVFDKGHLGFLLSLSKKMKLSGFFFIKIQML